MKEQIEVFKRPEQLTSKAQNPYSVVRGNSMQEMTGDILGGGRQQTRTHTQARPGGPPPRVGPQPSPDAPGPGKTPMGSIPGAVSIGAEIGERARYAAGGRPARRGGNGGRRGGRNAAGAAAPAINVPEINVPGVTGVVQQELDTINRLIRAGDEDPIGTLKQSLRDIGKLDADATEKQRALDAVEAALRNARDQLNRIRAEQAEEEQTGIYEERKLTDQQKETIKAGTNLQEIDRLFNRIFEVADTRANDEWNDAFDQAPRQELTQFMRTLNEGIREAGRMVNEGPPAEKADWIIKRDQLTGLARRYADEKKLRELLHVANYVVYSGIGTAQLADFMQGFRADYADVAFSKVGAQEALHFYEQALLKVMAENDGYLPAHEVTGEANRPGRVEQLARQYFDKALAGGLIKDGDQARRVMEDWEINRAFAIARGMGIVTARTLEIAAQSKLPSGAGKFVSIYAQDIIKDFAPVRHLLGKFEIGTFPNGKDAIRVLGYLLNSNRDPWLWNEAELEAIGHDTEHNPQNEMYRILNDRTSLVPHVGHGGPRRRWEVQRVGWGRFQIPIPRRVTQQQGGNDAPPVEWRRPRHRHERWLSILNPFRIGGVFTNTGWRVSDDEAGSMVSHLRPEDKDWVGAGIWIQKEKGNLDKKNEGTMVSLEEFELRNYSAALGGRDIVGNQVSKRALARWRIARQLERARAIQPAKLFMNNRDLRGAVLQRLIEQGSVYLQGLNLPAESGRGANAKQHLEAREKRHAFLMKNSVTLQADLDALIVLQERALGERAAILTNEHFASVEDRTDPGKPQRVQRLARLIAHEFGSTNVREQSLANEFLEDLEKNDTRLPFNFGTDDANYRDLEFKRTGGTGIARRWRDIKSETTAAAGLGEFIGGLAKFKDFNSVAGALEKIYQGVSGYDANMGRKIVGELAEGAMKFYGKGWMSRIPGASIFRMGGRHSYAQVVFGTGAMAWDEVQLNEFTRVLRDKGILSEEEQHRLQSRAGGRKRDVIISTVRTLAPLILLAISWYLIEKIRKEK